MASSKMNVIKRNCFKNCKNTYYDTSSVCPELHLLAMLAICSWIFFWKHAQGLCCSWIISERIIIIFFGNFVDLSAIWCKMSMVKDIFIQQVVPPLFPCLTTLQSLGSSRGLTSMTPSQMNMIKRNCLQLQKHL